MLIVASYELQVASGKMDTATKSLRKLIMNKYNNEKGIKRLIK